ncbi:MAG: hypothetical protein IPK80_23195 [Nannocystis sp.]|nr:hypothetical protein [Nannocystis sp.]
MRLASPLQTRRSPTARRAAAVAASLTLLTAAAAAHAAGPDVLLELHFKPVPNAQIAIWIEDSDGKFVRHVYVTQATGKLGIGNRSGRWDFLSSWRAPYGARPSVLPVWAHRHGKEYPKVVFYDDDPSDHDSLGWHENSSSPESYFCRPLSAEEHATIAVDTMTCPSPQIFQSDKGYFEPGQTSPYPPRNDLLTFEDIHDSPDTRTYADINDLDAYTAATPTGDRAELTTALIPGDVIDRGPVNAYIEVSLEHDENPDWDFDRAEDHFIDTRLPNYGIEYLGQPSVVYKVSLDATKPGFVGATEYVGYGDWDGKTGALHPPDATISAGGGSGADRLQLYSLNGQTFRFGVYSHGRPGGGGGGDDTGGDDTGWGGCTPKELAPVRDLYVEGIRFDKVRVHFTLPAEADADELSQIRVFYHSGEMPLTAETLSSAYERSFNADIAAPGEDVSIELDQLWGNYTYKIGVVYEDRCANRSGLVTDVITTETQEFQQVESFCFLATAAYGAPWIAEVGALRYFRDAYLKVTPVGRDLVRFYYTYSPPLARVIQREPVLRGMVRAVVQPLADVARAGGAG